MTKEELFGRLTPDHFANGGSFDLAVFATLKEALQTSARDVWKAAVGWFAMFGAGLLFAYGIGGFIGNIIAVFCFILSPVAGNAPMMKVSKQIKSAYKTLGITQKDVNAAIKRIKEEAGKEVPL